MRPLAEAFRGMGRKPGRTILSILGIAVALVMFGVLAGITIGANGFMDKIRTSEEITLYILDSVSDADMLAIDARAAVTPGVASTRIVTKESAAQEFERMFGKNLLSAMEENPLPRSIVLTVAQGHRSAGGFKRIAEKFEGVKGIESVEYGREWVTRMDMFFYIVLAGEAILILMVGLAGILVISNSIGITFAVRRGEIEVMRLVGATDGFIRRPFYLEGIFQGLVAGGIAWLVLYSAYLWMLASLPSLDVYLQILGFPKEDILSLGWYIALIVPAGIFLGFMGSFIAVRRDF
jgi:cell division transport system permease protein